MAGEPILEQVKRAARQRVLYLPHAVRQMSHSDRMIAPAEVEHIAISGEVIEDYPQDPRGPSCLLLGVGEGGPACFMWYARQKMTIWLSSQRMCLILNNGRQMFEGGGNDGLSLL